MKVTIIGTGNMARGIGTRVPAGGHAVTLVGTEEGKAESLATSTMSLAVASGTSGAEEIAKATPAGAKVVKAFNTTFAGTLVAGQVAGHSLDVLIAGDDADAKAATSELVSSGGLRAIDAGPLQRARQLEALGLLHMALQFTLNTGFGSAVKINA